MAEGSTGVAQEAGVSTAGASRSAWAWTGALWIVALAALSIVAHGHNYGVGNHVIYLAWIDRLRDPAFLARDWYLTTPIMHPNVVVPLRWMGDWLGDPNAFLLALFITRVILAAGVWRLARGLGGTRWAAGLAVALVVLAPRVSLGGHYPSGSYFEASHLGVAFAAVALAFVVERRWVAAGIAVGLAGHFHLFLGAHVGAIACLAVLLEGGKKGDRHAFPAGQGRESLAPQAGKAQPPDGQSPFSRKGEPARRRLAALAKLAIPALIVSGYAIAAAGIGYFGESGQGALSGRDMVEILCFRHPHHHSPLSWPPAPSALALAYLALGAALAWRAGRRRLPLFQALYGYGVAAVIIGTVFVEWIPVSLVALFQFFRVTTLLMTWTAVETALWVAAAFSRAMASGLAWARNKGNGSLEFVVPPLGGLAVSMPGESARRPPKGGTTNSILRAALRRRWATAAVAGATAISFRAPAVFLPCAAVLWSLERLAGRTSGARPPSAKPTQGSAKAVADFRREGGSWAGRIGKLAPWLAVAAAAAGGVLLGIGAAGWLNPLSARVGRADHFRLRSESPDPRVRALCQWVGEHTPRDAVFLAPPTMEGFRIWARRAEVVDFKNMTFTRPAMREWFDRICRIARLGRMAQGLPQNQWSEPEAVLPRLHEIRRRLGLDPQPALAEGYLGLTTANVRALAERYHFDYFIADSGTDYAFNRAGEAGGYVIYEMERNIMGGGGS